MPFGPIDAEPVQTLPPAVNGYAPSINPVWGIPRHWNVSDLEPGFSQPVTVIPTTGAATISSPLTMGARSIDIHVNFTSSTGTVTVTLYDQSSAVITSWPGVNQLTGALAAGNLQFINLGGNPFSIGVSQPTDGSVSVDVVVKA